MSTENATRRPDSDEYFEYYEAYISLVPDGDFLQLAKNQCTEIENLLGPVTEEQASVLHAPYTWTIKQVVGHLIDAERIFGNRLHRFACNDLQTLPGMEQNPYVDSQDYNAPSLQVLVEELVLNRKANFLLLQRLQTDSWDNRGVASDHPVTVRALAYMLVGHIKYHLEIVEKRLAG